MRVSPVPQKLLDRDKLVQRNCKKRKKKYMDVLAYRDDYRLTTLDKQFIKELFKSKKICLE